MLEELGCEQQGLGGQVGHYLLQRPLGRGSYGYVWQAYDLELGRNVAVKIPRRADSQTSLFEEARLIAQVSRHPNVVDVYEVGVEDGEVWMVMPLLGGATLRQWLELPHSRGERLRIIRGIASGLAAIHQAGLVHGDVKPENIVVTPNGEAVLTDLGGGRLVGAVGGGAGTRHYWAPEVRLGGSSTPESDQYAFGKTAMEVYWTSLSGLGRRGSVWTRPRLARILNKALQRQPERRWSSMGALSHRLAWPKPTFAATSALVASCMSIALVAGVVMPTTGPPPPSLPHAPMSGPLAGMAKILAACQQEDYASAYSQWLAVRHSARLKAPFITGQVSQAVARAFFDVELPLQAAQVAIGAAESFEACQAWESAAHARTLASQAFEASGGVYESEHQLRCAVVNLGGVACR